MENQPVPPPSQPVVLPTVEQPKSHKARNILAILISLFVVGLLSYFYYIGGIVDEPQANDIAPIDDSDLRLGKIAIADADNGYYDLKKVDDVIYLPKDKSQTISDILDGKTWDNQLAQDLVSKNAEALKYFSDAANKPSIQNPESADPANINPSMTLVFLGKWRNIARISSVDSLFLARQGKSKEAMDEAFNIMKVGQKIQDSQISMIGYLVGVAIKNIGLSMIQKIISTSNLSGADLKEYAQRLNQYSDSQTGLINAFKAEYALQIWHLDLFSKISKLSFETRKKLLLTMIDDTDESIVYLGLPVSKLAELMSNPYYFERNKTQLLLAENSRTYLKNTQTSCGVALIERPKQLATDPATEPYEENIIGNELYDIFSISFDSVNLQKCKQLALLSATQAMLAIKAYKGVTKKYPVSLDDLVPGYLSSIPQDPFDGGKIKYSMSDKRIYSSYASSTYSLNF